MYSSTDFSMYTSRAFDNNRVAGSHVVRFDMPYPPFDPLNKGQMSVDTAQNSCLCVGMWQFPSVGTM